MTLNTHILLVDDNRGDAELFRLAVAHDPDVTVDVVVNAVQAHDFLAKRSAFSEAPTPDVIFLDLNLPIFPGQGVLEAVKRDPCLCGIKVVIFTSSELESDRAACASLGADDYIVKPMTWSSWQPAILAALGRLCRLRSSAAS
jgi:CheY-like chemotaxis protein